VETKAFIRVNGKEQGVDEVLHAQMLNAIITPSHMVKRIIVVTCDGNTNGGGINTCFYDCILKALHHGVNVDLWACKASCGSCYETLASSAKNFNLYYLESIGI